MSWINQLYVPARGVKLGFHEMSLSSDVENGLFLQRRNRGQRIRVFQRNIVKDEDSDCFKRIDGVDFEIVISRNRKTDYFELDFAHAFVFLLLIKNGGWINAPALLSASMLDPPDIEGRSITCEDFIDATPCGYAKTTLSSTDAKWIKKFIPTAVQFMNDPRFQNAMQALNSFHCIPYGNVCLLTAWSGLEALFKTDQEISFRLSLYVANFLRTRKARKREFSSLRTSYAARSRIAHGQSTSAKNVRELAVYTRDILRECLRKCIEENKFPEPETLIFGE